MRRQFYSKNIRFLKFFDQNDLGSLPRIFLCSLLMIFFFYSMPIILSLVNENDLAIENNSKINNESPQKLATGRPALVNNRVGRRSPPSETEVRGRFVKKLILQKLATGTPDNK